MKELTKSPPNAAPYVAAGVVTTLLIIALTSWIFRSFIEVPRNVRSGITIFVVLVALYPFLRRIISPKGKKPLTLLRWSLNSLVTSIAVFLLDVLIDGHL